MIIKQVNVFLENQTGTLSSAMDAVADAGINVSALSLADNAEFGLLRLIVDNPEAGKQALEDAGMFVRITPVVAVAMEDAPGGARAVLKVLADAERNIEYMYAFVGKESGKALTVLCTDDNEAAEKVLEASGFNKVNPKDVYRV